MFTDHFVTKIKGCTVSYEPIPTTPSVYGLVTKQVEYRLLNVPIIACVLTEILIIINNFNQKLDHLIM